MRKLEKNLKPDYSYSRREARLIAGIAILLMLCLHFFSDDSLTPVSDWYASVGTMGGKSIEFRLSVIGQLCVGLFAFNSGYVIYKSADLYKNYRHNLGRIAKLLTGYWLVMAAFFAVGWIYSIDFPDTRTFVRNLFGFNLDSSGSFINVCYGWYVHYYIFLMILAPLMLLAFEKSNRYLDLGVYVLMMVCLPFLPFKIILIVWPLPASFAGFFVCKYNLIGKIRSGLNFKRKSILLILSLVGVVSVCTVKFFIFDTVFNNWCRLDGLLAFILITSILLVADILPRIISGLLMGLGAISMYIWFLHSIFAVGPSFLKKLLFMPYYPPIILAWALFLLTIPALFFKYLHQKVIKFKPSDKRSKKAV